MNFWQKVKAVLTTPIGGSGKQATGAPEIAKPIPAASAVVSGATGTPTIPAAAVINALNDGVMALDRFGNIRLVNPAALRLAGFALTNDAVGLNYSSVVMLFDAADNAIPDNDNPIRVALSKSTNFTSRNLKIFNQEQKTTLPIALQVTYSVEDDAVIVVYSDISDEVQESRDQLAFVSTASHEMRTPVAEIEGYLSIVLDPASASVDTRARDYVNKAHTAALHLGTLLQQLLDTTRLSDHQMTPQFQAVEVGALLLDIATQAVPLAAQKQQVLSLDSVPLSATTSARVKQLLYAKIDPDFLREIVNQLLENAFKYTPAGGRIDISAVGNEREVAVMVRDTGVGIPQTDLPHVFQKFYRVDNSDTREQGGSGLGLFIASQRAEAMGGKLYAESQVGQGSVFYLRFPRISEQQYQEEQNAAAMQVGTSVADVAAGAGVAEATTGAGVSAATEVPAGANPANSV
ncbi:MAG: PAS domain-containing protein [Candidatus Nomurabacteria bacterium]|jgi:signal transduction histidine kinase|nr:PAS domain-containing protein [Candidatus Nomurabacteria bacterium]